MKKYRHQDQLSDENKYWISSFEGTTCYCNYILRSVLFLLTRMTKFVVCFLINTEVYRRFKLDAQFKFNKYICVYQFNLCLSVYYYDFILSRNGL